MGGNEKRNVNENQARTVKGESELFVNTVLEGMTADIFIEKWKNDVDLILDLEENPEYGEKKLFDDLLARMTNYYENNQNSTGPASYFNMLLKKPENVGKEKEYNEQLESIDKAWQRVKSQWSNYTEDLKHSLECLIFPSK